jgi:hypothetical protein
MIGFIIQLKKNDPEKTRLACFRALVSRGAVCRVNARVL